jgi:hypothetical protein
MTDCGMLRHSRVHVLPIVTALALVAWEAVATG